MNQSIQFPDREEWDEVTQIVRFPVLINGMLAECSISKGLLQQKFSMHIEALSLFKDNRWDIEDEFEALIEQGPDSNSGVYILSEDR